MNFRTDLALEKSEINENKEINFNAFNNCLLSRLAIKSFVTCDDSISSDKSASVRTLIVDFGNFFLKSSTHTWDVTSLLSKSLKFIKLKKSPLLGEELGNKNGYDLTGYRKMYVCKKQVRIVYSIVENKLLINIIAIGKRNDMAVYETASKRVN